MMLGVHRSLSFCCYWGDILGGYRVHPLATLSSSHRMWPGGRGRCLKQISIAISMYYSLQQPFRAQKFRSTTILVWNSYLKVCTTFWVWDPHDFGGWVRVVKRRFWRELTSLFVEWNDLHLVVVPTKYKQNHILGLNRVIFGYCTFLNRICRLSAIKRTDPSLWGRQFMQCN